MVFSGTLETNKFLKPINVQLAITNQFSIFFEHLSLAVVKQYNLFFFILNMGDVVAQWLVHQTWDLKVEISSPVQYTHVVVGQNT